MRARTHVSSYHYPGLVSGLYAAFVRSKPLVKGLILVGFLSLVFILACNLLVVKEARPKTFFDVTKLPSNETGLVLGTSKSLQGGGENLYFKYRMEATAQLYRQGKIKQIILSGNNDSPYYNEPLDMKTALLGMGVPEDAMQLDYSGVRTFDSILRCKKIFKQEKVTIISQDFHNVRALYIANHEGMDAIAFAARDVPKVYSFKTLVREYLARPKAVLDVHLFRPDADVSRNIEVKRK